MDSAAELTRVLSGRPIDPFPQGFEVDVLTFPGGAAELGRAREVMTAVLTGEGLPPWFVGRCVDDGVVQTCNLDRWSLRAWVFWLQPDNRRWWWWAAETGPDAIGVTVLVRSKPYLRGSLEWLFKASAAPPPA